jgi:hypothetical protein
LDRKQLGTGRPFLVRRQDDSQPALPPYRAMRRPVFTMDP